MERQTIVLDFDGVIHSYKSGWKGPTVIPDEPVKGIRLAIANMRWCGYEVVVVSTRCTTESGKRAVEEWLKDNDIVVDRVESQKPPAVIYVDDRALTFDGDCTTLLDRIKKFKPWYAM